MIDRDRGGRASDRRKRRALVFVFTRPTRRKCWIKWTNKNVMRNNINEIKLCMKVNEIETKFTSRYASEPLEFGCNTLTNCYYCWSNLIWMKEMGNWVTERTSESNLLSFRWNAFKWWRMESSKCQELKHVEQTGNSLAIQHLEQMN